MTDRIDLHLHSTCSDGTFTPEVVAKKAHEAGLKAISLTDHDSIDGVHEAAKEASRLGLEVIPGAELSAQTDGKDVHILGYFLNCDHPALIECLQAYRDERKRRAEKMVKKLHRMGLRVPFEQVLAKAGKGAIGRPHVADVMVEEGFVFSANEAFHKYLGYSKPAYESKYSLPPREAIGVIHDAGGLACLAHPGLYDRDDLIPGLVEDGLDGIEVCHTKHDRAAVEKYTEIAKKYDLAPTGGSDCHGDGRGDAIIGTVDVPAEDVEELKSRASKYLAGSGSASF